VEHDWRTGVVPSRWRNPRLNSFAQFTTPIFGHGVHFIHVRSSQPGALPVIMTHGWPGSIVEFVEVIGPLNDSVLAPAV
jgi:microsomal epoxide hydrolase